MPSLLLPFFLPIPVLAPIAFASVQPAYPCPVSRIFRMAAKQGVWGLVRSKPPYAYSLLLLNANELPSLIYHRWLGHLQVCLGSTIEVGSAPGWGLGRLASRLDANGSHPSSSPIFAKHCELGHEICHFVAFALRTGHAIYSTDLPGLQLAQIPVVIPHILARIDKLLVAISTRQWLW